MSYRDHQDDSDLDEYDPSFTSPTLPHEYDQSPTESEHHSNQHTPTTFVNSGADQMSPSRLITNWTADQCADYISDLGFEDYAETFIGEMHHGRIVSRIY